MRFLPILLCLLLTSSCSQQKDKWKAARPDVVKAKVIVLLDESPLEEAKVFLNSADGKNGAFAQTDGNGQGQLTTFSNNDGAVEGTHQVRITKETAIVHQTDKIDDSTGEPIVRVEHQSHLPKKYASFDTSGLSATISKEGSNEITLKIYSK